MPNAIKYSTTGDTLSLKKGNIFFGVGDVGKGPSSATTYYNGVTPSAGGYTIYSYNASQTSKLSFHSAADDAALREYTNNVSGGSFATAAQCLNWYATQTNYVCVNRDYEGIVTNGLVFNLDAGFTPSYTTSGTSWYDLSYSGNNGTLTNGPTFNSSNGGNIVFDGVDDYVDCGNSSSLDFGVGSATIGVWFKTSTSIGALCTKRQGSGFQFYVYSNKLYADGAGTPTGVYSTANVNTNTWVYGVVVYDRSGGLIRLYVNGVADGTTSLGGTTLTDVANCNIGRETLNTPGDYYNGNISLVHIYNRALSATEVLQNFNAQKSRFGL